MSNQEVVAVIATREGTYEWPGQESRGVIPFGKEKSLTWAKTYWEAHLERTTTCQEDLEFLGREWEFLQASEQGCALPGIQGDDSEPSTPGCAPPLPPKGSPVVTPSSCPRASQGCILGGGAGFTPLNWQRQQLEKAAPFPQDKKRNVIGFSEILGEGKRGPGFQAFKAPSLPIFSNAKIKGRDGGWRHSAVERGAWGGDSTLSEFIVFFNIRLLIP